VIASPAEKTTTCSAHPCACGRDPRRPTPECDHFRPIPARVGGTRVAGIVRASGSAHPCACGRDPRRGDREGIGFGPSLRVWAGHYLSCSVPPHVRVLGWPTRCRVGVATRAGWSARVNAGADRGPPCGGGSGRLGRAFNVCPVPGVDGRLGGDVDGRVHVPVADQSTRGASEYTLTQGEFGSHATLRACLAGRIPAVNDHQLASVPASLVVELAAQLPPSWFRNGGGGCIRAARCFPWDGLVCGCLMLRQFSCAPSAAMPAFRSATLIAAASAADRGRSGNPPTVNRL
jgi:hypothetical protein